MGPVRGIRALVLVFWLAASATGAHAAETGTKPLFELGAVGGAGYVPDYPAADESRLQGIGLPFVVYRGEFLRAGDRGFVRGRLLRGKNFEFDISLSGSFPTDSDDNDARMGMPDLDWLGEVGPRLQITLARAPRDAKIELELPLRLAFSTNFTSDLDFRGLVFAPELAYQNENFLNGGLEMKVSVGSIFATEELMEYFYEVSPRFVTPTRPAFAADGGYLGSKLQLLLTKQVNDRVRTFFGLRGDFHHGASNDGSPLFRRKTTFTIGMGLVISLYQSERRVRE
jgi:outer membrane scaffolding protein for murein synthesis (MipA/OmpV family)